VYFPREVLPISAVIVNGVNFLLALLVLIPVTVLFGISPDGDWLLLPIVLLSQALFTLGITLIVAGLNVFYRDTEYIVEVALLAWFFLTPIFYDIRQVTSAAGSEIGTLLLALNPMATYVTAYRSIFLTHTPLEPGVLAQSMVEGLMVCAVGYLAFVRMSRNFGDVL
jgi:ABC-type polysaccharide/polyol phosphate export permease